MAGPHLVRSPRPRPVSIPAEPLWGLAEGADGGRELGAAAGQLGAQGLAPAAERQPPPAPWALSQVISSRWGLKNHGEILEEKSHKITKCIKTTRPSHHRTYSVNKGDAHSRSSLLAASTGRCVGQRQAARSRASPPSVPTGRCGAIRGGVFALSTRAEPRCSSHTGHTGMSSSHRGTGWSSAADLPDSHVSLSGGHSGRPHACPHDTPISPGLASPLEFSEIPLHV